MIREPPDCSLNQINFYLNTVSSLIATLYFVPSLPLSDPKMFNTLIFLSCSFRSPRIGEILLYR